MMTDTLVYFGTILAGSTVTIFNNFAMTLLRSVGNSKVPLASMIASSGVNIVLDLLFVFPFGMGVFGAALATVLAQVVSALYCLVYIRRAAELLPRKTDWRADGVLLGALVGKGLPVAVMNSVTAVGGMVLQVFVNQMGTAYVAAYAACMKVCGLFEQPGITLGLALLTFTGQNYGAKKLNRVNEGYKKALLLGAIYSVLVSALFICIPGLLVGLFVKDEATIIIGSSYLRVLGIVQIFSSFEMISNGVFSGLGLPKIPSAISIIFTMLRIPMALVLVKFLGINGVWWSIAISNILKGSTSCIIYRLKIYRNYIV